MSWVPVPSPSSRMRTDYREAGLNGTQFVNATTGVAPPVYGYTATYSPAVLSGSYIPAPPTAYPQQVGSFTAPPLPFAAPSAHPSFVAPPGAAATMGSVPLAAPLPPATDLLTRRSWTPAPMVTAYPPVDRLGQSCADVNTAAILQGIATYPSVVQAAQPLLQRESQTSPGKPPVLEKPDKVSQDAAKDKAAKGREPRQPTKTEGPAAITLNVYWQRKVDYDENGRVQRRMGGDELTWGNKMLKDVLGVYHVGIDVHGSEYTFGNYHAPNARSIGGPNSGVMAHDPRRPGPNYVFKQAVPLGHTRLQPQEVENLCGTMGGTSYSKAAYNRIQHNCVDFSQELSERLGGAEIPLWCYRGAATARLFGWGLEKDENDAPAENRSAAAAPPAPPTPHTTPTNKAPGQRSPSKTSAAEAPGTQPATPTGALASARQPPPVPPQSSAFKAGSVVASPPMKEAGRGGKRLTPAGFYPGRRVSVMQGSGAYLQGKLASEEPDGTFTVRYDSGAKEAHVLEARIVLLAEAPPALDLAADATKALNGKDAGTPVAKQGTTPVSLAPATTPTALPPATPVDAIPPATPFSGLYPMALGTSGFFAGSYTASPSYSPVAGYQMFPRATVAAPARLPARTSTSSQVATATAVSQMAASSSISMAYPGSMQQAMRVQPQYASYVNAAPFVTTAADSSTWRW
mmetsp:Transcript_67166/g.160861  ORF Transcript_67166/g.160861 Transcript_67166/m.160861 type:complete len:687 (-) Transcript_67166:50-2110(-)